MFIKPETQALISSILNDKGWIQCDCYMANTESGAKIWTANGSWCIDFYPNISAFNFFERRAIHGAIKKRNVLNSFPEKNET